MTPSRGDRTANDVRTPSPDNPAWSGPEALLLWLVSVLAIVFLPLAVALPYAKSAGFEPPPGLGFAEFMKAFEVFARNDSGTIVASILGALPAHIVTILAAWLIVTRFRREPFLESLGWEWGGFKLWHGVALLAGFFALSATVTLVIPEQEHELTRILKSSRSAVYAVAFLATFTAPLVEEVVYRGVLYSAFQKSLGRLGAVLLATFLFAVIHVPQYMPSYATIILIFVLSLALTVIRAWTDNLLPCVAFHLVFNGVQSVILIAGPLAEQSAKPADSLGLLLRFLT